MLVRCTPAAILRSAPLRSAPLRAAVLRAAVLWAAVLRAGLLLAALLAAPGAVAAGGTVEATPATLARVLAAAAPGTEIRLAPGRYDRLGGRGIGGEPGRPLVLRPADPADPPHFASMNLRDARHLVLEGLVFDYRFTAGEPIHFRPFQLVGGTGIVLRGLVFDGDVARGRSAVDDGFGTGFGLALTGVSDTVLEASEIRGFARGLVVARSRDLAVRGNDLHSLRMDGMNFAQVQRVTIEGNTIRDFLRAVDSPDHADMIQFWTNRTDAPSTDIVIRGNILLSGRGAWTQSIFIRNEEVDTGRAGPEMFYRNLVIADNFILNAHLHGITVGETRGLVIRHNTVVRNPLSEGPQRNPPLWAPTIRVAAAARDVTVSGNVTARIAGPEGQPDWRVEDNLLVQDRTRMEPNHYSRVFVGGDPADPASFAPLPGGPLYGRRLGAPLPHAGRNSR